MIWRAGSSASESLTVWRRTRKIKDRWPLITVERVLVMALAAYAPDVGVKSSVVVQAVDTTQPELRVSIFNPGVLFEWRAQPVSITNLPGTAVTNTVEIQTASLLPRTVACDELVLETDVQGTFQLLVEVQPTFITDHEAWKRKKQRDCHDE